MSVMEPENRVSVIEERPAHSRSKSTTFSYKSDKSGSSSNSKPKFSFGRETHEEKERQHLTIGGKANPNAAMNEAEPGTEYPLKLFLKPATELYNA